MAIEIKAPQFPESVADGSIATWHKKPGEPVQRDELLVDIETDKVVLEVVAPADGQLVEILKDEGDTVLSVEVIARFEEGTVSTAVPSAEAAEEETVQVGNVAMSPSAKRLLDEKKLDAEKIKGTGKGGRISKEDVQAYINSVPASAAKPASQAITSSSAQPVISIADGEKIEKRVPMTRLRKSIAKRLKEAQETAALLTTFNEVNMEPVMTLRSKYKDMFEKVHNGTRLGFMSFFVKATTEALKRFPDVNASIDGDDIVYHGYQDIGIAVSSDRGLVVPILRDCDRMNLADIEAQIRDFGARAQKGGLGLDELQGGTFTITNGGVFGSLMSTPILTPPQTAILGMHKIQERPMAVNGEVKILPMMYLALTYDHRLIDGKDAVQFLVAIKDMLEDPARILLDL
ncbi:2-oxoglutarate dehydrogenase complex dihydrolipoyllysine-residue succinyltransferase [Gynuella sunshinyii]|uniref:Dihydrolipoyllysine-residue succinyltransferase component of 2-oxoglutarate dehydrogenase complex n=1 Tax=Gynuella sunshinyii YC6258 TaxID=1445510 RepID=A0A0C5VM34_9GAMM|nr:2-oxoglutarate dehydrogenase complex dihydrolipoyllysine-residue succinyltransferase [Gynuella sunshinyii]AJQ95371.1 pyruvate/2-oxoglutarate dehydrogenase complex, dihydrolipoamide acyltransferase (E2) component,-related enzyme [Gynuella sunshinyii YC6258]